VLGQGTVNRCRLLCFGPERDRTVELPHSPPVPDDRKPVLGSQIVRPRYQRPRTSRQCHRPTVLRWPLSGRAERSLPPSVPGGPAAGPDSARTAGRARDSAPRPRRTPRTGSAWPWHQREMPDSMTAFKQSGLDVLHPGCCLGSRGRRTVANRLPGHCSRGPAGMMVVLRPVLFGVLARGEAVGPTAPGGSSPVVGRARADTSDFADDDGRQAADGLGHHCVAGAEAGQAVLLHRCPHAPACPHARTPAALRGGPWSSG
jgi:hypothetical protein